MARRKKKSTRAKSLRGNKTIKYSGATYVCKRTKIKVPKKKKGRKGYTMQTGYRVYCAKKPKKKK